MSLPQPAAILPPGTGGSRPSPTECLGVRILRCAQNDMQNGESQFYLRRPERAQRVEGPASPRLPQKVTDSSARLWLAQNDMQNGESQFYLRRPERAQRVEGPASPRLPQKVTDSSTRLRLAQNDRKMGKANSISVVLSEHSESKDPQLLFAALRMTEVFCGPGFPFAEIKPICYPLSESHGGER